METKAWLGKCYPDSASGKSTIIDWFAGFKRGRTNIDDVQRSGGPKEVIISENIKKFLKIALENRKVKLQEIVDTLNISKELESFILREHLSMRKLFSKWVPRSLPAPCHRSLATMAKLHELHFELLPHPPYSPDFAPRAFYLVADLKKMLASKRFVSNVEVITESNAYFEAKDNSFLKKDIEMLVRRWNDCIALKRGYVDE